MPTSRTQTRSRKTSGSNGRSRTRGRGKRPTREAQSRINELQVEELVLQALETELGGVQVYETALRCAQNDELREEWEEYHEQTQRHVQVAQELCERLGIDAEKETPGRRVVRSIGESLVEAMEMALAEGQGDTAQLVATECVTLAEVKDHQNWALLGELCDAFERDDDPRRAAVEEAVDEVEDEEDEHLYHTMGWSRELWIESLGLPAALPPPEEKRHVKSMAQAAKAKGARKQYAKKAR